VPRRFKLLVTLGCATIIGLAPAVCARDQAVVVERLQARYDATRSFKASFRQEIESRALGQSIVSRGTVYFRRPGRMRWEFNGADRQTVIADGKILWMYQAAQRQVVKIRLDRAFHTAMPLSFLVGLGNLRDDFEARLEPGGGKGRVRVRLRPLADGADVGALVLDLDADTYDIVGAFVTDAMGGTTRWMFSEIERNIELGDDLFAFTVPPGVDVVVPPS